MSYTYEIIRENGKITDIKVNGNPVKRGSMRGIRKAQKTNYWNWLNVLYKDPEMKYIARNPWSGVEIELNPLEMTIYNWLTRWYEHYCNGRFTAPIQAYDDMKYFLMELNSQAYMDLID